jgi:hypothetical protein
MRARAADAGWTRPDPESGPTALRVHVFVIDVDGVSDADQTFTANIYFEISWKDPRLADESGVGRRFGIGEIWHPTVLLVNQQKLVQSMPDHLMVGVDGTVVYRQQVWGNFSQPLDLRKFPFDSQEFGVQFACPSHGPDEIVLEVDSGNESGIAEKLSVPDWAVDSHRADVADYQPVPGVPPVPGFVFAFSANRASEYYVIKVIIPLLLILVMASVVFWIDPSQEGTQIGVSTTAMLTLIAYRFAISSSLPAIPYLTRMDIFVLACTILVAICLIEVVITSRLANGGRIVLALRIDRIMRVVFPVTVAVVGAYAFFP